jgi:biotin operon repressor
MAIINTTPVSNYTRLANDIINSLLPPVAKAVLLHLLTKPAHWQPNKKAIAKALGLSAYAVQKAIGILTKWGHLIFKRTRTGHGTWHVYSEPQTTAPTAEQPPANPAISPSLEKPTLDFDTPVDITDSVVTNEINNNSVQNVKQPAVENVVVSLATHEQLAPVQIPESIPKACHSVVWAKLSTLTQSQLTALMLVYNAAIKKGTVKNPVGYLLRLIEQVQAGALTTPTTPQNQQAGMPLSERLAKQAAQRKQAETQSQVDNTQYFKNLYQRLGDTCLNAIPESFRDAVLGA